MPRRFHTAPPPVNLESVRRALRRWYRRHHRRLPWRCTRDPYRIWISEIMLQQTRVKTVLAYYRRWLRSLPDARALAAAPLSRVLRLWEGLGYYQRARNLHRAARQMRGRLPTTAAAWQQLPGVGRYTAAAIASIAYGERVAVLDTNVARVLTRLYGIAGDIRKSATKAHLWRLAETLLPPRKPGEFNQAIMELGALVCLPTTPRCARCPIRPHCVARRRAVANRLPNRGRWRRRTEAVQRVAFCRLNGKILLRQRPPQGLLGGLWELPPADGSGPVLLTLRHAITHRRIRLQVCSTPARADGCRWIPLRRLPHLPMASAHRRALRALLGD